MIGILYIFLSLFIFCILSYTLSMTALILLFHFEEMLFSAFMILHLGFLYRRSQLVSIAIEWLEFFLSSCLVYTVSGSSDDLL